MRKHNSITLELRKDKPENVYRYIDKWQLVPSRHGKEVYYLLLYGTVQWGEKRDFPANVFSIVMQYSPEIGKNVDISQPAHIHKDDIDPFNREWQAFIA